MYKWTRPLVGLVILSVSMLILSALFETLNPYLVTPFPQETGPPSRRVYLNKDKRLSPPSQMLQEPGRLIFAVSPADPVLYWRTSTVDYYDGLGWYRTTRQITTKDFPNIRRDNATQLFTVEFNMTERDISLPAPPPQIDLTEPVLSPSISHEYYFDEVGDVLGIRASDLRQEVMISYQAGWHHKEIDKQHVSIDDVPQEIRSIYLQLPAVPEEVKELAENLRYPYMNVVDQILTDAAYFLSHFEYDLDYEMGRTQRAITGDWVLSYLRWGKGVCLDAATALAVILRCQGIPSRVSLGYKPTWTDGDKVFYYSNTSHAETEAYLPPYGWVRFDATPVSPLDLREDLGALRPEKGLELNISPKEVEGYPEESVFYHLEINNSREMKDQFELSIHSTRGWNSEVSPEALSIEAFETRGALLEIKIPENATYGQADVITVTATSSYDSDVNISNITIARVGKIKRVPSTTAITYINNTAFRGDLFYVEGTVFAEDNEPVHDMPILILLKENKETKGIVCGNGFSQNGVFRIKGRVPFDTELGDHAVVAISLGTTKYAPSNSDPSIKVVARTYIQLDVRLEDIRITRPFLIEDHVLFSGFLRLDNGTKIFDADLELELSAPDSQTIGKHKIVAENGFFQQRLTFSAPGTYEIAATFLSRGYLAESYSYRKIEVGSPTIQNLTGDYGVRGEVLSIRGNVSSNDEGIPGEPVTLAFDGATLAIVETELDGTFSYNWKIGSEVQPGWHLLAYTLQKRKGVDVTQYVEVMVKTQVAVNVPEKVAGGNTLTCSISLRDDYGVPIRGEEVFVGALDLSSMTDNGGNVEIVLDTLPFWWGNMNLTVTFKGSAKYLPSTAFALVAVQPGFAFFPFVLTALAVLILGLIADHGKFKRLFHNVEHDRAGPEKISTIDEENISKTKIGKRRSLRIGFPDIRAPFPNVWGIGDNLRIECTLDKALRTKQEGSELELFVNDQIISKDRLSKERSVMFSHIFEEKGKHEVGARLVRQSQRRSMKVNARLSLVDYREEIVRLYKTFLQHLVRQNVNWDDNMTAREVESLLLEGGDFDPKSLHRLTGCFEKAQYSHQKVNRAHYAAMYLSLKEMIDHVD